MKKKLLNINCTLLVLCTLLINSCGNRKTGTLKIDLELNALNGFTNEKLKESIIQMIQATDDVELKDIVVNVKDKQVNIEVKNFIDNREVAKNLAQRLCQQNSGLQIYEAFEAAEIFSKIDALDKLIKSKDTASIQENTKEPETLSEIVVAKKDSIAQLEKAAIPFKGLLNYNITTGERGYPMLAPGPVIGFCDVRDTSALFQLFRIGYEENILPKSLVILTKRSKERQGMMELYTLRLKMPFGKPTMDGDMIQSAEKTKNDRGGFDISMQFKPTYVEDWKKLTKASSPSYGGQGKFLAMVHNNEVLSAPSVYGEISNGTTMISGNFTVDELNDLCERLTAGYMPSDMRVQKVDLISNK
jgi:SecD/SecF fusion protein